MNGNQKNTLKFINTPKNQYAPHGNGYALYSLSLHIHIHTTTTTSSSCSYLWSPSREEYIPQNVHSLSSLYVSSNNNKIWTASKTTGKMYCVDPTVRKVVGCWSIPSLCDDGGAIMNRDGFYGNGSLICGVDLDLVMEDDQEEEDGVVNEFEKKSREEERDNLRRRRKMTVTILPPPHPPNLQTNQLTQQQPKMLHPKNPLLLHLPFFFQTTNQSFAYINKPHPGVYIYIKHLQHVLDLVQNF
uniref:Uncharacterized protein n=1 Tax=Ditylum brightwellii TaxID=49249 RepID=A0A7S4RQ83_9STRA